MDVAEANEVLGQLIKIGDLLQVIEGMSPLEDMRRQATDIQTAMEAALAAYKELKALQEAEQQKL